MKETCSRLRDPSALVIVARVAATALLAAGLVPTGLRAQRVQLGPVFGLDVATTYTTYDCPPPTPGPDVCLSASSPADHRIGPVVGGFAQARVSRYLAARAELTYTQKGYGGTQPELREHYLELPVLLRLDAGGATAGVFISGGVGVGTLLACRLENPSQGKQGGCDDAYMRRPHFLDPEWLAGVGLRAGALELEGRFARSLASTGFEGSGAHTVNETYYLTLSVSPGRRSGR